MEGLGISAGPTPVLLDPAQLLLSIIQIVYEGTPSPKAVADHAFSNGVSAEDGSIERKEDLLHEDISQTRQQRTIRSTFQEPP